MKVLVHTLILTLAFTLPLMAQTPCSPDLSITDTIGVFPAPFDPDLSPDGGITDAACINTPYEFVFTAVVGDTLRFAGAAFTIDSLVVDSVVGLPAGLNYACNPPTCVFDNNSSGCIVLSGTADASNIAGEYELLIGGKLYSGGLNFAVTFPDANLAPGTYALTLRDEGEDCVNTGLQEFSATEVSMTFAPNPVTDFGRLTVEVADAATYEYEIFNLLGQVVYSRSVHLNNGVNTLEVDVTNIPQGVYLHSLRNGQAQLTERLLVSK